MFLINYQSIFISIWAQIVCFWLCGCYSVIIRCHYCWREAKHLFCRNNSPTKYQDVLVNSDVVTVTNQISNQIKPGELIFLMEKYSFSRKQSYNRMTTGYHRWVVHFRTLSPGTKGRKRDTTVILTYNRFPQCFSCLLFWVVQAAMFEEGTWVQWQFVSVLPLILFT